MTRATPGKTVLVVGGGGREAAIAWKFSRSPQVSRVIVAPGNAGMLRRFERWEFSGKESDFAALAARAREAGVSLAFIGPDDPLALGIVDVFKKSGVPALGPTKGAAQIEASKAMAKDVMRAAGIPTAAFRVVSSLPEAEDFLRNTPWGAGWVVKADGLALGKGVQVCSCREEALAAARSLISISEKLVIEERLEGEEVSWMAFCDGERCALFEPARDHKTLYDGGRGPNTGGMGAFSPVPGLPEDFAERVKREVFLPTLAEMKKRGVPFRGLLYAGLMVSPSKDRFSVLEFNSRFGDPEAQVLLLRMQDDLLPWCEAVVRGDLTQMPPQVPFSKEAAVIVVAAAPGYPGSAEKGIALPTAVLPKEGPRESDDPEYFTAGVVEVCSGGGFVTSGGRVFGAVAKGLTLEKARATAYERLRRAAFPGMQFRTDIGGSATGGKAHG